MKKTNELQFSDTGTVIGTTGFVDGLAEKIIVQLIRRLYLQLDGKIHYNFFDEGLVAAETGALHCADVGSQPSYKQKFGSLAHFITALNTNKTKSPFIVDELSSKVCEIASHRLTADLVALKLENSPIRLGEIGADIIVRLPNTLAIDVCLQGLVAKTNSRVIFSAEHGGHAVKCATRALFSS